jgi:hypothetical protein
MPTMKHRSDADAVLSSVRHLVTQERRWPEHSENGGKVERLLLTPALRVDAPLSATRPADPVRQRRDPSPLELRIAELEKAVGGVAGDWEPDGSEAVDEETPKRFAFAPPHQETHQETCVAEAPRTETAPVAGRADEATEDPGGVPEMPEIARSAEIARRDDTDIIQVFDGVEIDEEHLREIVAQMVRAELQGELGERITRNVRKLVRREIHQALLTRNLD